MRPILFQWGPFRLYGYGTMIVLGGILSFWFLSRRARRLGLRGDTDFWILVNVLLASGFISGRLLFLAEYTRPFSSEFWRVLVSPSYGFSVLGAFIGVPLGVWGFCRWRRVAFLPLMDTLCVMAPLWHAVGRIGCFLAGCCYGRHTDQPWGVPMAGDPSRHPTQLYEAFADALIAAWLYGLLKREKGHTPGLTAARYFAAYGVLRFGLEFFRGDTVPFAYGLTMGQGLGLALIAAAGGWACFRRS